MCLKGVSCLGATRIFLVKKKKKRFHICGDCPFPNKQSGYVTCRFGPILFGHPSFQKSSYGPHGQLWFSVKRMLTGKNTTKSQGVWNVSRFDTFKATSLIRRWRAPHRGSCFRKICIPEIREHAQSQTRKHVLDSDSCCGHLGSSIVCFYWHMCVYSCSSVISVRRHIFL